jgi:hypothetical protein
MGGHCLLIYVFVMHVLHHRNAHIIPSNIIISTQSMMMIPKTIRLNANLKRTI